MSSCSTLKASGRARRGAARSTLAAFALPQQRIQAERPGAGEYEIEEHEAIQDREFAVVQIRVETVRRVREKTADDHFAGHDQRNRPGEQAERQQNPAAEFDQRGKPFDVE